VTASLNQLSKLARIRVINPGLLNMQAALRTCECLGIQDVWLIGQPHQPGGTARLPDAPSSPTASESRHSTAGEVSSTASGDDPAQWLTIRSFLTAQQCIAALRDERCTLWSTDLSQSAETLDAAVREGGAASARAPDPGSQVPEDGPVTGDDEAPPGRLAVAFSGSEGEGVSRELLDAADKRVYLPLHGGRHSPAMRRVIHKMARMQPQLIAGGKVEAFALTQTGMLAGMSEAVPEADADLTCCFDCVCRLHGLARRQHGLERHRALSPIVGRRRMPLRRASAGRAHRSSHMRRPYCSVRCNAVTPRSIH